MDKKEYPDRVQEIVKSIKNLECESSRPNTQNGNDKRLKYALLEKDERNILSQDPFACFRMVSWTYRDLFIGLAIIFIFYFIGKILSFNQHFGINIHVIFFFGLIIGLLHVAILFSYPYYVCHKRKIWPLFPSLSFPKLMKEIIRSIGFFFLLSLSIGLVIKLFGILARLPVKAPEVWKWTEYAQINQYFIFFLFVSFAIIPIIEEVFFRGFLYNALKD